MNSMTDNSFDNTIMLHLKCDPRRKSPKINMT